MEKVASMKLSQLIIVEIFSTENSRDGNGLIEMLTDQPILGWMALLYICPLEKPNPYWAGLGWISI